VERVDVDGMAIAFERAGSGPPIVLLHGGMSDHREWRAQLDDLSDSFTVLAWDAPGCGGSDDPPAGFAMADYADALAGFLATLGIGSAHLVGLSWGSTLALELYRRHPHVVRTMILTAAYAGWAGSLAPEEVAERLAAALQGLEEPPEAYAREWLPTLLTDRAPEELRAELVRIMASYHPEGTRAMLNAIVAADLRDVLPTIAVPTLLLAGEEDVRSPRAVQEELHARIPGSTMRRVPGAGHQCTMEAPAAFDDAVRSFLSERG